MKVIRRYRPHLWSGSPTDQLTSLRDEINRLFELPFGEWNRESELFNGWTPALDLYEDKDNITVKTELPGMKREDIEISYHDGALTISGERKIQERPDDTETYRSERFLGRFHRTLTLPKPVQTDKAKATYKDGILTIVLPKTEEAKPKQITVNVA